MEYYEKAGYPIEAVIESIMTIINSNFEEWRTGHPDEDFLIFRPYILDIFLINWQILRHTY